ncbi:glycoside hydrolase family 28 protein [Sphingobacterium lactis]|uniref:glycoside hydrolase family 28 protein n=1 Tax=Sphingobacterium lactis TaxID=797291 RepID=UPI003EC6C394
MKKIVIYFLFIFGLQSCAVKNNPHDLLSRLVKRSEVGAENMPNIIAAVYSPYFNAAFKKPTFPNNVITVEPGGEPIQHAIDSLEKMGGGTVKLAPGHFLSGRITLKSNIELQVHQDAILEFKSEIEDFLPVVFTRNEGIELYSLGACIYAENATNIAITGKGKIYGPGQGTIRERTMTHDVIENIVDHKTPVDQRIYDGKTADFIFPPALIAPIHCKGVYIEGVSLAQSAFWNIVPTYCENVIIRGISINSIGIQRGDGIDVESSRNVLIEYCSFETGDDCIALKAGRGYDGLRVNKPTENIVIRNCYAKQGHGGMTIGSETAGMVQGVYVHNCVFDGVDVGLRFKTRRPRGGGGKNILFENIYLNTVHSALRWDMLGQALHVGNQADRNFKVEKNPLTPRFSDIEMRNIYIENAADCIRIEGIPESKLENVKISSVNGKGKRFLVARDAKSITIQHSVFAVEDAEIDTINVQDLNLKGIEFNRTLNF